MLKNPHYFSDRLYNKFNENILSRALEFKFLRSGYDGVEEPFKNILYDLRKLDMIGRIHHDRDIKVPFSEKCTLLVFIGKRQFGKKGNNYKIIEKLDNAEDEYKELLSKFKRKGPEYSDGKKRCVIRYELK